MGIALHPVLIAALALVGCATSGIDSAQGCFAAANGQGAAGRAACTRALADPALPADLRGATLVNRGIVDMQGGRAAAALGDFDAAIALLPGNPDAWLNKGIALLRAGRDADALAAIDEALRHNPRKPELAYYYRAIANEGLGRLRAAYDDYVAAAGLAPDWAEPATQLQRFKFVRRKVLAG